jgi:hypothetical protein
MDLLSREARQALEQVIDDRLDEEIEEAEVYEAERHTVPRWFIPLWDRNEDELYGTASGYVVSILRDEEFRSSLRRAGLGEFLEDPYSNEVFRRELHERALDRINEFLSFRGSTGTST